MRISFGFALGIAAWFTTWGPLSADDFKLPPDCTLPFDNIATKPGPAAICGFDGSGTGGAALTPDKVLEDHAKNNFCADVSGKKIGEGNVVRLLAFVKEAHISDCEAGEDVNCKTKGVPNNDFHIPLVNPTEPTARNLPECTSITAEMSPHFRPVRVTGQLFYDNSHEPSSGIWTPYDQWVDANPDKVQATGQKQREECGGTGHKRAKKGSG